jgi:hypothetical protein
MITSQDNWFFLMVRGSCGQGVYSGVLFSREVLGIQHVDGFKINYYYFLTMKFFKNL